MGWKLMIAVVWPIFFLMWMAHGDLMTTQTNMQYAEGDSHAAALPLESGSSSELLSANHLFVVEILDLTEHPWGPGPNGLEQRRVRMNAKLLETFKGDLDLSPGKAFALEVQQRRESEFVNSDYHGMWSHISPKAGTRYLVFADASSNSPAALMQEGACEKLLGPEYISDVHLAVQAETLFQHASPSEEGASREHSAMQSLLRFSNEKRSQAKDLYERYLWARVNPAFREKEPHVLSQILGMVAAPDGTLELRSGLISGLYNTTVDLQPDAELTRRVLRVFFSLLLQKEAAPLQPNLVDVEIYGLAFEDDKPALSSASVFPDAREREHLKSVVHQFDSERAHELSAWLGANK
jgi:hypothetical protein